jgi:hypothetical protein
MKFRLLPKQLSKPDGIIKTKPWHIIALVAILLIIATKSFAVLPLLVFLGGVGGGVGITNWLMGDGDPQTDLPTESGIQSVGGDIFVGFYDISANWLESVFIGFAGDILMLAQGIVTLVVMIIAFGAYFNKLGGQLIALAKFSFGLIIVITLIEDYGLFHYYFIETLLDIQKVIILTLFDENSAAAIISGIETQANQMAAILFGGVDQKFIEIFNKLTIFRDSIDPDLLDAFSNLDSYIAYLLLLVAFSFLYAIYFILIIISYFGFFLLLAFAPIIFFIALMNKQMFFSWLRTLLNYFLIAVFTAAVMSLTIDFIVSVIESLHDLKYKDNALLSFEFARTILIAVLSIGMHWKAPEFAAGITGGIVSSATSVVGSAVAVGASAWGLTKTGLGFSRGAITGGTNPITPAGAGSNINHALFNNLRNRWQQTTTTTF